MVPSGPHVRLSTGDLDVLTSDVGPAPAHIALLLALPGVRQDAAPEIARVLADRALTLPALGRAIRREGGHLCWVDAPEAEMAQRIRVVDVRGGAGVLPTAARLLTTPLDLASPPWVIEVLLDEDGVTVVLVAHHVLTDGLHGLAMLTSLADLGDADVLSGPATAPPRGPLGSGACLERSSENLGRARGSRRPRLAPRTSLNGPTGADRGIATHTVQLDEVRAAARRAGATLNDVLIVVTSAAVAAELHRRGEHPPVLKVWVPVSTSSTYGSGPAVAANAVGVMIVPVDLRVGLADRLAQVAGFTRQGRSRGRHPAAIRATHAISEVGGRLGLASVMFQRQRLGNTSLSTMRGPEHELRLAGHPVRGIIPAAARAANVAVSFLALSYAGSLTISVVHDPAQLSSVEPMMADLAETLEHVLAEPRLSSAEQASGETAVRTSVAGTTLPTSKGGGTRDGTESPGG